MSYQNILLFFPIVEVSYCNDDFILLVLVTILLVSMSKLQTITGFFSCLVHTLISATTSTTSKA